MSEALGPGLGAETQRQGKARFLGIQTTTETSRARLARAAIRARFSVRGGVQGSQADEGEDQPEEAR